MAVLEPGRAHLADGEVEPAGDLPDEVFRAHRALLDPEVEEIALAARLVGGDLLDLEVLGRGLDAAADPGEVVRTQGGRCKGVERHGSHSLMVHGWQIAASIILDTPPGGNTITRIDLNGL